MIIVGFDNLNLALEKNLWHNLMVSTANMRVYDDSQLICLVDWLAWLDYEFYEYLT